MSTRPPLMSPSEVACLISSAVKEKQPFSFVRLGDSEGMMLLTRSHPQTEEDRYYLRTHFDSSHMTETIAVLTRELVDALNTSDLIGNRDDVWYADPRAENVSLDDAEFPEIFRNALKLREVERSLGSHALRRLFGLHEWTLAQSSFSAQICSSWVQYDLALMGFWDDLLGSVNELTLINCSPTLPSALSRTFSIDVRHIMIPDLEIHRDRWDFDSRAESIYPDSFRRVHAEIEKIDPGRLCLIGAGVPGKSYAAAIKRRGGIALDLGGLLDAWDDRLTRPLVFSTKNPSSEPETAHRSFMLGALRQFRSEL